jgi:hypothetical protein
MSSFEHSTKANGIHRLNLKKAFWPCPSGRELFLEACACVVRHYFNRSGNPITAGKARGLTSLLPGTPPAIQKEMPKITPFLPPIRGGFGGWKI